MNYTQEIANAIAHKLIRKEDVYEFEGSYYEQLFSNFHKFCRGNLNIHAGRGLIRPNSVIFNNDYSVNASASLINGYYRISINLGLFQSCITNYYDNDALGDYFFRLYPQTFSLFDNALTVMAFQICTQFTYHHELAHLFQYTVRSQNLFIQERNNQDDPSYDESSHFREINADTYASIAAGAHIGQYVDTIFKDNVNEKNVREAIIFFGSCLLNYTLNLSERPEEIYFRKFTHPHSFIRQLNMLMNMVNYIQQSPWYTKVGMAINGNQLFSEVVDTYKQLEAKGIFRTNISAIIESNKELEGEMVDYIKFLTNYNLPDYANAIDIWNLHIQ